MNFKAKKISYWMALVVLVALTAGSILLARALGRVEILNAKHFESSEQSERHIQPREAMYYAQLSKNNVRCQLCPNRCFIAPGQRGFCEVRENRDGRLYTLVYGLSCALHVDPIEKKPLFHFLPASRAFSIATAGCNLECKFCQNWQISQARPEETSNYNLEPEQIVRLAKENNCEVIAYTYTEPTIFYEYMLETAKLARKAGIKNIMHSNGYINEEPLRELCEYLDGANIDLKGFTEQYYAELTQGHLQPVLNTLKILKEEGVHLEITNLILPAKNDDPEQIKEMCIWIKENLGDGVAVHFSRFYPMYKLKNLPPTPVKTLELAKEIADRVGLEYVYIGNVPGHRGENTYCPKCGKLLVQRIGYHILQNNIAAGRCKSCGQLIPGVWSAR